MRHNCDTRSNLVVAILSGLLVVIGQSPFLVGEEVAL